MNGTQFMVSSVQVTGVPFNDAYRYMDWLLTVPLLLIEIILVMDLSNEETVSKAWQLGSASALMIILGYPGDLLVFSNAAILFHCLHAHYWFGQCHQLRT